MHVITTGLTPKSSDRMAAVPVESQPVGPEELKGVYAALDTHLRTLYAALPPRTAIVLFSSHSDPRRMSALNARKFAFDSAIRSGKKLEELAKDVWWTTGDGRELEEVVELTKRGLLFLCIKS
jgi:RNA exonuclease 1